jgi:hypothetical protein
VLLAIHKVACERQSVRESDFKLDFFATQSRRGRQGCDLVERPFELLRAFNKRVSRHRALPRCAPPFDSGFGHACLREVMREQLRLALGYLCNLVFERFSIAQTEALTRQNPVLMIFEDAHWTDPTSLEVFGRVVDRVRSLRVLLIVTFRPDFDPPWVGRAYVTFLAINRLGEREIIAMIEGVIGNKALPANIRQDIIERTDGIPLFVEEMTKAVLEAESQGAVEHLAGAVPSSTLAVPASLQASLMARLDRLGPAKEVAQIGAAIGREFSHALMAAVTHKAEVELQSALDRLMAAGLLFRQGAPPHATYLFKHALVRDAAYGTLLREPRRALHASIGISAKSAASWVEVEVCASTASSLSSFACAVSSCTSPAARSIWLTIG